jgi:hypothetical protein
MSSFAPIIKNINPKTVLNWKNKSKGIYFTKLLNMGNKNKIGTMLNKIE